MPVSTAVLNDWLSQLQQNITWEQHRVNVFNRIHPVPRLTAFYGDTGVLYSYAGFKHQALAWNSTLLEIKMHVEESSNLSFNSVLLNLYRDGNDRMGWHADNEPELGKNPAIASVSLGASRFFDMKHRTIADLKIRVDLHHGSLLMMEGSTQHHWLHQIPTQKRIEDVRINLTFRTVVGA